MFSRPAYTVRLLIIILAFSLGVKSQSFHPRYNFKHLNVQNGLTQNIVYHFLQDSQGYMWIGTHNGLSLYDGIKTINFLRNEQDTTSLSGNFITNILEDSALQIWVGTENGIDLFNRAQRTFSHFAVDRPDGTKDNTYCVPLGFASAHELWFLDTKTRSIRSLQTITGRTSFVAELNAYHALFYKSSTSGKIHIWSSYDKGTIHQVFSRAKLIAQQLFFAEDSENPGKPPLEISHVFQQNDSTAWLSTNEGLVRLNPERNIHQLFQNWGTNYVKELRYAALSPKGQLWISTGPGGIYTFDMNANRYLANFRNEKLDPSSICSDNIVALYFDKSGNLWCGSYGSGCSYTNIENNFFQTHLPKPETDYWQGNNNISWLGMDSDQKPWCMIANAPGFWLLNKDLTIREHKNPFLDEGKHFNSGITKLLFDSGGNIWCATNIGLYRYDLHSNRMLPVKYELLSPEVQGSIWVRDIISLRDGSILFSTFAGLYRLTTNSGKSAVSPLNFLKPGQYNGFGTLFQDQSGLIYAKTLGDSLYVLKQTGNAENEFKLLCSLRFSPQINQYFQEKGDTLIYLATTDGLYQLNYKFRIEKRVFVYRLPFVNTSSVFKKDGQLWIFGEKGLFWFDDTKGFGRIFTVEDGLPSNEFAISALVQAPGGKMIAGTTNGLVSFSPDQQQDSVYPPRPQLLNIYVNDTAYHSIYNANETGKIILSYKENTFSFDFAPLGYQHVAENRLEYKLEGYDERWIPGDVARYTRYSKIPPGTYRFSLRVIDVAGRISPYTKTLEIEVERAFWQTTYFKTTSAILLLLAGWMVTRWYLNNRIRKQKMDFDKQQAIERERTRIATDMHDDLGAGLSRIRFLSQALSNKKENEGSVKSGLEQIIGYSDEMTEKMGEIVWALNEKNDTLADLVAYTRSYAVEYLANHQLSCDVSTPLNLPATFIAGELRRNIFLSVKECLHNIVKHAGASTVHFSIQLNGNIEILIHDDGKGIDWENQRAFSNGLQNIRKRMKDIHGTVDFINENGTKVILQVPLDL